MTTAIKDLLSVEESHKTVVLTPEELMSLASTIVSQPKLTQGQVRELSQRFLFNVYKPGDYIYTMERGQRRKGTEVSVAILLIVGTGIRNISYIVAAATGYQMDGNNGVWASSASQIVEAVSIIAHGTEHVGTGGFQLPTPERYIPGHSLLHFML